jgi:hypothetical protein
MDTIDLRLLAQRPVAELKTDSNVTLNDFREALRRAADALDYAHDEAATFLADAGRAERERDEAISANAAANWARRDAEEGMQIAVNDLARTQAQLARAVECIRWYAELKQQVYGVDKPSHLGQRARECLAAIDGPSGEDK